METQIKEMLKGYDLINKTIETIELAEKVIKENDWQIKGDVDELKKFDMSHYQMLSKNNIKRLNRYIWWFTEKPSISNINRFFHFICTRVLKTDKRVRVYPSIREQEIQAARKRWKDVQKVEQELLKKYKEIKGDFYKLKNN